jgi:hypothetical protein
MGCSPDCRAGVLPMPILPAIFRKLFDIKVRVAYQAAAGCIRATTAARFSSVHKSPNKKWSKVLLWSFIIFSVGMFGRMLEKDVVAWC